MLGNVSTNAISKEGTGEENLYGIFPYIPRSVLNNWTAKHIPVIFRTVSKSSNINDMSDAAADSNSPSDQDMCSEEPKDFEDDRDCNLSPNLLRMVEYNQIKIHLEDIEKTTFVIMWGTFCYKVMPFGLKNCGSNISKSHGVRDEECHNTFSKVKHYLSNALVLMPPRPDKPLILYLAVFENSMGCILGQHDEQYMLYHTTWLISKMDLLKYMMESTALNGRMTRWQILLSEFDIIYVNQKAIKRSAIANFLTGKALENYEPLNFDFPNEDLRYVATTKEGSPGIPRRRPLSFTSKLDFDYTNNKAEYDAFIMDIHAAIELKIKMVDTLATLASMVKVNKQEDVKPIQMSIYEAPSHCYNVEEEEERDDRPWYHDILRYVKKREYPEQATKNDKRTIRRMAN
ncbi:RNA-directed DNA polymerase (Reverse transcriptase), Ribonuclease H-like protein [Gossypium australe]|uniref:RNA-directed DNA polymerase (Reverse transcriptase), Ribonuclease H-like protein n=1 Tax=Gossypium australe TaxID=47621 RepID=A0A5B6WFX6_9ROSI|nr:RNA-directed DNA polymerase (Reverse transcriptase), Ribonuclease H-like protein [Gossypium australe]